MNEYHGPRRDCDNTEAAWPFQRTAATQFRPLVTLQEQWPMLLIFWSCKESQETRFLCKSPNFQRLATQLKVYLMLRGSRKTCLWAECRPRDYSLKPLYIIDIMSSFGPTPSLIMRKWRIRKESELTNITELVSGKSKSLDFIFWALAPEHCSDF